MRDLLDELWEKTNLTYISDLKGRHYDEDIKKSIKQIPVEDHKLKEWKDVFLYLGADVKELDSVEQVKNYISKL